MTKHLGVYYAENKTLNRHTKKESIFENPYLLKDNASAFLRGARIKTSNPSSLVYITNIKNMKFNNKEWSRLGIINRLFYVFAYAEEKKFYAINIRFSHKIIDKLESVDNKSDFLRRRININFKNALGYIPQYAFILEEDKNKNLHLHGVMEVLDPIKTKHILKTTCYGKDYKESSFNKYIYHYEPLYNSGRWCAYCLKGKFAKNKEILSYCSRELTSDTKKEYHKTKEFNKWQTIIT